MKREAGKTLLISFGNPHTRRLGSWTIRRLTNLQVIITNECDNLAQLFF